MLPRFRLLKCRCHKTRPHRYRSVTDNRHSALINTPSGAAAGAANVPLSLSLQTTPLTSTPVQVTVAPKKTPSTTTYPDSFSVEESQSDANKYWFMKIVIIYFTSYVFIYILSGFNFALDNRIFAISSIQNCCLNFKIGTYTYGHRPHTRL